VHGTLSLVAAWTVAYSGVVLLVPAAVKVFMMCLFAGVSFYSVTIFICYILYFDF